MNEENLMVSSPYFLELLGNEKNSSIMWHFFYIAFF